MVQPTPVLILFIVAVAIMSCCVLWSLLRDPKPAGKLHYDIDGKEWVSFNLQTPAGGSGGGGGDGGGGGGCSGGDGGGGCGGH